LMTDRKVVNPFEFTLRVKYSVEPENSQLMKYRVIVGEKVNLKKYSVEVGRITLRHLVQITVN
jgi:hypothetical protein